MRVKEIVAEWLENNGYDGLYYPDGCACQIHDLAPCGNINEDCQAGHLLNDEEFEFEIGIKEVKS